MHGAELVNGLLADVDADDARQLIALNADADFMSRDLSDPSRVVAGLSADGLGPAGVRRAVDTLRAGQRMLRLAGDSGDAATLLRADYTSAVQIVRTPLRQLIEATGLDPDRAGALRERARQTAADVSAAAGGIMELAAGGFDLLAVSNLPSDLADQLRQLPGFSELFGNQAYCDCGECQSILSPAAYFCDLMRFVEEKVTSRYFFGHPEGHPLRLTVRRPDLWTLPLTCENTNTEIPVLTIVNEVLESYLARRTGFAGDLGDPVTVADHVYRTVLAEAAESTREPFLLPSVRAQAYLDHLDLDMVEVADFSGASGPGRAAAVLKMAWPQFEVATTPNQDPDQLRRWFGLPLADGDVPDTYAPVDVVALAAGLDVSRELLGQLVLSRFVVGAGAGIEIVAERSSPDSTQNDVERVHGLTPDALDHLNRFARLQRQAGCTPAELDLILTQLGISSGALEEIVSVTQVLHLRLRLAIPVEEAAALATTVPLVPAGETDPLFHRLFNAAPFIERDGPWPVDALFVHPALRDPESARPTDAGRERLLTGLGINDETLLLLIRELAEPLGANPEAELEDDRGFALTVPNLSLLYRHARLARLISIDSADLFRLAALTPSISQPWLTVLEDVNAVLETHDWWATTAWSLDDLAMICGRPVTEPAKYPDPVAATTAIRTTVAAQQALTFTDTVLALLPAVSDDASRRILAANPNAIVAAEAVGRWRLADTVDLTEELTIPEVPRPDGTPGTVPLADDEAAVRSLLAGYHPSRVLPRQLAGPLRMPAQAVGELLAMRGVNLFAADLRGALAGAGEPAPLVAVVRSLIPLTVLFRGPQWDADALAFARTHPALFDITDMGALDLWAARGVADYVAAVDAELTTRYTGVAATYTPADVRSVLAGWDVHGYSFDPATYPLLARIAGTEQPMLESLVRAVVLPGPATSALQRMRAAVGFTRRLGIGGDTLADLVGSSYEELERGADALLAGLRATVAEADWAKVIGPVDETIRGRQRDALVDHLRHSDFPQFTTDLDLYDYFLLDVSAGGCATTSRVVSATNSVQQYIRRIRLNLEQDRRDPDDPQRLAVPPEAFDPDELVARISSAAWVANRKIFLWPENYLTPDLRDDKTPLFTELEGDLLQRPIDDQGVLDAYAGYLAGVEELAGLQFAGAYHQKDTARKKDVLHLFGATRTDPPLFYYRTLENAFYGQTAHGGATIWTPWRKIDLQVGARRLAPVVLNGRLTVFWAEYATKSENAVVGGESTFKRYVHTTAVKFASLRLDGRWTAPQRLNLAGTSPFVGDGLVIDNVALPLRTATYAGQSDDVVVNDGPVDSYGLRGFRWDQPYPVLAGPNRLLLTLFGFQATRAVDLFTRGLTGTLTRAPGAAGRPLIVMTDAVTNERRLLRTSGTVVYDRSTQLLDRSRLGGQPPPNWAEMNALEAAADTANPVLRLGNEYVQVDSRVDLVNGAAEDCLITTKDNDLYYLQHMPNRPGKPANVLRRVTTTLGPAMARTLFTQGVDGLLSLANQQSLAEPPSTVAPMTDVENLVVSDTLDFGGAFGGYFREIFRHVPTLIAYHLNADQRYAAAQSWYQRMFDPTANDHISDSATPQERARAERDRPWRVIELRGLDLPSLRKILTQPEAIAAYHKDPFNPHAIARLRPTAIQKNLVFGYVDNLLDWADSRYTAYTRESVNEAFMLYAMAAQILGPRPVSVGGCSETLDVPRTYEYLAPILAKGSEFLAAVETMLIGSSGGASPEPAGDSDGEPVTLGDSWRGTTAALWSGPGRANALRRPNGDTLRPRQDQAWSLVGQLGPVFCIPRNPELLGRWERVERRMSNIRHCLDIDGNARSLALFEPDADPRLLARARALGLSLDDVVGTTSGAVPPQRFSFLIDVAKSYAAAVQSLGAALLSALEKKDAEELTRLRATHEQHLLELSTRTRQWEIDVATSAVAAVERQITAAEYRRDHYRNLHQTGLIPEEQTYNDAQLVSARLRRDSSILSTVAGILYLLPQLGSPFSMKYGGQELGNNSTTWASVARDAAGVADAESTAAKMKGDFSRRNEEWAFQAQATENELAVLRRQLAGVQVQQRIAEHAMELHRRTQQQSTEVFDFYLAKFSSLGRYTELSTVLQRLHRDAYSDAYALARLAEQAYLFERPDAGPVLDASYWEPGRAGLLAGERLLGGLHTLQRRFLETDERRLEITQSFSLAQLAPLALATLRDRGTCRFTIPELAFDLVYPGHYRRRIRSVRISLPAVTGPYVNVGATLELVRSWLRIVPKPGTDPKVRPEVPQQHTTRIATSSGLQDGGVFELNFRDDRYLPFEGAGAVSEWQLRLPTTVKPFDYHSIPDVVMHIAYTAEIDEKYGKLVEHTSEQTVGSVRRALARTPMGWLFSLRRDYPSELHRLLTKPAGTEVEVRIGPEYLPFLLDTMTLTLEQARLAVVRTPADNDAGEIGVKLNDVLLPASDDEHAIGDTPGVDAKQAMAALVGTHTVSLTAAADGRIQDVLIYVELTAH